MEKISITVANSLGTRSNQFRLPPDTKVRRLISKCESLWGLPSSHGDGQPVVRYFVCKRTARQLSDQGTLDTGGVIDGDSLELKEKMVAGR
ncbi:hypothetical protein IIA16_06025 [bacterium]|nr:hypothetical protein [bacterium]